MDRAAYSLALGLLASFALAAPTAAQTSALPPQVTPASSLAVSNTVHCAYDQMSTEDREMALLLFEREVGSANKAHINSPNLKVIDRLVDEALVKCATPYAWSNRRSDTAEAYAMNELMSEGVAQALEAKGHTSAQVDRYFAQHRGDFAGKTEVTGPSAEAFRGYLVSEGWTTSETAAMGIAEFYLESLLIRENQAHLFAAALNGAKPSLAPPRSKPKSPPSRARTAGRGKP